MLYLHHANHLERLAQHFALLQRIDPLSPLGEELVVVQNNGMGRWLSLQVAQWVGVSANVRYLFPAEMSWELQRKVLVDVPDYDPCAPATLRWRLLAIFLQEPQQWQALGHYLVTGAEGAWQLAGQIAKVFDQYLFFRPEWVRAWERGEEDHWQARLWRRVVGQEALPHWVRLQERFAHALQTADVDAVLPKRICFFSVPVLSPGYVQLLAQVAEHSDIHIYLMNPSPAYWGDIESEKRKYKQSAVKQALTTVGNPLLASWGRQGRDFLDQLLDANAHTDDLDLFIEPDETTLLQHVQADIFHLRMPEQPPAPLTVEEGGFPSISFHACHSPLREAEVLYQQLLVLFAANPGLTPADVVVMSPAIDTYAPYLEAVFATADPPLPYSIADSRPHFAQGVLGLCQQLLALPQSRCEAETVLALLEFTEVRDHLGLDEAGVAQCRAWVRAVNIRWGADVPARQVQGGAGTLEHTWRYGFDRLLLGYALPGEDLFAHVLPFNAVEGSQAELLGRLQQWLDAVLSLAEWGGQSHTLAVWEQRFRQVLAAVVGDVPHLQVVWQALDTLKRNVTQADFFQPIAWAVFQDAFAEQLDKRSASEGFLGRGITFCALMPMRTVPFRFVGLLGMNDGVFPRRDVRASFDLMAAAVRRGDRLRRDEDRYLFLESVLSVRDWLYISYVGQSQQDNSALPPSVLVSELLDYLERCGVKRADVVKKHRLQDWERPSLPSPLSRQVVEGGQNAHSFNPSPVQREKGWGKGLYADFLPPPDPRYRQIGLPELIRFYQNPARFFLRERFGLRLGEVDETLSGREPFAVEGYRDADIRAGIFHQLEKGFSAETALPLLRAQGLLPHGQPGELLFAREQQVVQRFFGQVSPLPVWRRCPFTLVLGDFTLGGVLGQLDGTGRKVYALGKLSYWQWLELWLQHLVLNALPDCPYGQETQVLTLDKTYHLGAVEAAGAQLHTLLLGYWRGLQAPLPFFPKTAFEMAQADEPTCARATSKWLSSYGYVGECEKPEYRLLYRDQNPLETQWDDFLALTQQVFGQLFSVRT